MISASDRRSRCRLNRPAGLSRFPVASKTQSLHRWMLLQLKEVLFQHMPGYERRQTRQRDWNGVENQERERFAM